MTFVRHFLVTAAALAVLVGIPLGTSPAFRAKLSGVDAVSSATAAIEQPSGEYVVFMNTSTHYDETANSAWKAFFEQGDSDGMVNVFEDVVCTVASNDPAGLDAAKSFMSRLPENQMKVRTEDSVLMLSKAEHGRFDIIVMSKEIADSTNALRIIEQTSAELYIAKGEEP